MTFKATSFVFDEIPGETYNLFLYGLDTSGIMSNNGSSDVSLITKKIFRRPVPYFYGVEQTPVLQFGITFFSPDEITADMAQLIQRWLFGQRNYKKLQIVQDDMLDVYFNCVLTEPNMVKVGGVVTGFTATVVCDSPYAWTFEETLTKTYATPEVSDIFYFYNLSDDVYYLFPQLDITLNGSGDTVSILNITDNNREFLFSGLTPGEVLSVDNDLKIITSSSGLLRLPLFNKNWFRLLNGVNQLKITGNVEEVIFTYRFPKKIGG